MADLAHLFSVITICVMLLYRHAYFWYGMYAANSFDARKLKWGMTIQLKQYISLDDMTLSSLWKKKKIVFIIKQFIPVPEIQETFRHF